MKRISSASLLVGAALLLGGCEEDGSAPAAVTVEPPAAETPPRVDLVGDQGETSFHASDPGLNIRAIWSKPAPGDWQVVELVDPLGNVYLRRETPLDDDGSATLRLPLRGSYVEDHGLTGTWTARIYKNSATAPIHDMTFDIQP